MNEATHIRCMTANYKLAPSQLGELPRLDRLLRSMMGEALELALERAGVRASEIVCIKRIHAPVRLRLSLSDSAVLAEWARAIAEAIANGTANALRYRSRSLALVEMGRHIAHGHFDNVWAWRQLGFWTSKEPQTETHLAARQFAHALTREPEAAVAVLSTLAASAALHPVFRYLDEELVEIAIAVLIMAGLPADLLQPVDPLKSHPTQTELQKSTAIPHAIQSNQTIRAARVSKRSRILAECAQTDLSLEAQAAIALLALLECEPSLTQASHKELAASIRALRAFAFHNPATNPHEKHSPQNTNTTRAIRNQPTAFPPATRDTPLRTPSEPPPQHLDTPGTINAPEEALTEHGGLLFLIRIVDVLNIPKRVLSSDAFALRSLPWFLHRLALTLQPLPPDDPAALAFCGLAPDQPHPSHNEPKPSQEEQSLIENYAQEIRSHLAELLAERLPDATPQPPERILQTVCRRDARIVADPGWIEIRFSLRDISTAIRRAALDLDPNYVPWLGVVVRYVYE